MAWTTPRDWTDGEFVTEAIMDTHIRDNFLGIMHPIVIKPSDEAIAVTTMQTDDHLIAPVLANEVWLFQYFLRWTHASSADVKLRWTFPTGGAANLEYIGRNSAGTVIDYQQNASTSPLDISGSPIFGPTVNPEGFLLGPFTIMYTNGGTGGNFGLDWAPSTATTLTMKAKSSVWGAKIS